MTLTVPASISARQHFYSELHLKTDFPNFMDQNWEYCSPQQLSVRLEGPPKDPINHYAFSFMVADVRYYTLSTAVKGLLDHGVWKLLWQAVKTQQLALTDLAGCSNTTYNSIWSLIILASELEITPGIAFYSRYFPLVFKLAVCFLFIRTLSWKPLKQRWSHPLTSFRLWSLFFLRANVGLFGASGYPQTVVTTIEMSLWIVKKRITSVLLCGSSPQQHCGIKCV